MYDIVYVIYICIMGVLVCVSYNSFILVSLSLVQNIAVRQTPSKGQDPPAGPRTLVTKSVKIFALLIL